MTGRTKIKDLTTSWYLYTLFSGVVGFLMNGMGVFSLLFSAVFTGFGLFVTFLIGRALLNRNGFVRGLIIFLAGLSVILGGLGVVKLTMAFFSTWTFSFLWSAILTSLGVMMNAHSLRVLFDRRVRRYFRR